jgi:hypothetical protein
METPFGSLPNYVLARASMAECDEWLRGRVSRRTVLKGALAGAATAVAGPILWQRPGLTAQPPAARHLAFGDDPRTTMTISWLTTGPVAGAVVDVGPTNSYGQTVPAASSSVPGTQTVYHHARVAGLSPNTAYHYRVRHAGAESPDERFRTAPAAPQPFTFTAFGDQGVSDSAVTTTARVAGLDPAFHFHVGDLCYAYILGLGNPLHPFEFPGVLQPIAYDAAKWDSWLRLIEPASARAPWMTTVGNHEMEPGFGPLGYNGYLTRTSMPATGPSRAPTVYAFRYGNVGLVALDGNDASAEIRFNQGYTEGAQDRWLRATLKALRSDPEIDFIVVGFHNCAYCTNAVHASDGGIRNRWGAIFDRFAVDLVINGHNHCYERTHPIRDGRPTREVRPGGVVRPARDGTTYITAGGGGQAAYQAALYPASYVVLGPGLRVPELAPWSATRYLDISLIAVDVTPRDGTGTATMTVRALRATGSLIERITLRRTGP